MDTIADIFTTLFTSLLIHKVTAFAETENAISAASGDLPLIPVPADVPAEEPAVKETEPSEETAWQAAMTGAYTDSQGAFHAPTPIEKNALVAAAGNIMDYEDAVQEGLLLAFLAATSHKKDAGMTAACWMVLKVMGARMTTRDLADNGETSFSDHPDGEVDEVADEVTLRDFADLAEAVGDDVPEDTFQGGPEVREAAHLTAYLERKDAEHKAERKAAKERDGSAYAVTGDDVLADTLAEESGDYRERQAAWKAADDEAAPDQYRIVFANGKAVVFLSRDAWLDAMADAREKAAVCRDLADEEPSDIFSADEIEHYAQRAEELKFRALAEHVNDPLSGGPTWTALMPKWIGFASGEMEYRPAEYRPHGVKAWTGKSEYEPTGYFATREDEGEEEYTGEMPWIAALPSEQEINVAMKLYLAALPAGDRYTSTREYQSAFISAIVNGGAGIADAKRAGYLAWLGAQARMRKWAKPIAVKNATDKGLVTMDGAMVDWKTAARAAWNFQPRSGCWDKYAAFCQQFAGAQDYLARVNDLRAIRAL